MARRKHKMWVRDGASSKHTLYGTWRSMRRRCAEPKCDPHRLYYWKGIEVYHEWKELSRPGYRQWAPGFVRFLDFIEGYLGEIPPGWSLDRIDGDGHYEPGNIRIAPPSLQMFNRRTYIKQTKRKHGKRWCSQSRAGNWEGGYVVEQKSYFVGTFPSIEECYNAVIAHRIERGFPIPKEEDTNENT